LVQSFSCWFRALPFGSKHSLPGFEQIPASSLEQPSGLLLKGSTRVSYKLQLLVSSNVVGGIDDKDFFLISLELEPK
jgi:hypothetical protein